MARLATRRKAAVKVHKTKYRKRYRRYKSQGRMDKGKSMRTMRGGRCCCASGCNCKCVNCRCNELKRYPRGALKAINEVLRLRRLANRKCPSRTECWK